MGALYAFCAVRLPRYVDALVLHNGEWSSGTAWQLSLGAAALLPAALLAALDEVGGARRGLAPRCRAARPWVCAGALLAACCWYVAVTCLVLAPRAPSRAHLPPLARALWVVPVGFAHAVVLLFGMAAVCAALLPPLGATPVLLAAQPVVPSARAPLRYLHRARTYALAGVLSAPLWLGCALLLPNWLQRRLLFQEPLFFFSASPRGTAWMLLWVGALFAAAELWMNLQYTLEAGFAVVPPNPGCYLFGCSTLSA